MAKNISNGIFLKKSPDTQSLSSKMTPPTKNTARTSTNEADERFKWLFTDEELSNTASSYDKICLKDEWTFRQKLALLIQTIGFKSGLTQQAINTSVVFMQRYFVFRTIKDCQKIALAIAFTLIGAKLEGFKRVLENIICRTMNILKDGSNTFLDPQDLLTSEDETCKTSYYINMRNLVLELETEIYQVIGFQLHILHPQELVTKMCASIGENKTKDVYTFASNLATTSAQMTILGLKYKPETIASMCLNIAFRAFLMNINSNNPNRNWYQVLDPQADINEINAVSEEFLNMLRTCPLLDIFMKNLLRTSKLVTDSNGHQQTCKMVIESKSLQQTSRPTSSATAEKTEKKHKKSVKLSLAQYKQRAVQSRN